MVTVKKLLTMMQLKEFTHVIVLDAAEHYHLGGGYQSDVVRRFGSKRVFSTSVFDGKLMIFVTR